MIENIESTITTIGFPIAITIYLLWERQNTTKEMIKVLNELHIAICKLGTK
jgi:hypothetical protein